MKFNQIINKVLGETHPRIKRKNWENKKLEIGFPKSISIMVLNNTNGIVDTNYNFSMEDLQASDWEVVN